jgi:hypothetical protein
LFSLKRRCRSVLPDPRLHFNIPKERAASSGCFTVGTRRHALFIFFRLTWLSSYITFIIRGKTALGIPYYGIGVFMPIMMMGFAIRRHILQTYPQGARRSWGAFGAGFAAVLSGIVFVGQIVGKWTEGGWIVLISFSILVLTANLVLISPIGLREPKQIHRIVREKARVQGGMASIVEWQSLRMQEYRYAVLAGIARVFELFGIHYPKKLERPALAGDYDHALHVDRPEAPSLLQQYLTNNPAQPRLGGAPRQTILGDAEGKEA